MAPRCQFEGIAPHELPYGRPLPTLEGLVRRRDQGHSLPVFGKFRSHPMMSNKSFGALLPPPRHRVPNWGKDRAQKNTASRAKRVRAALAVLMSSKRPRSSWPSFGTTRKSSLLRLRPKSRSGLRTPEAVGPFKSDYMSHYHPREVKRRRAKKLGSTKALPDPPSTRQVVMGVPERIWMRQGPALDPGQHIFAAVPDRTESAPEFRPKLELELQRRTVGAIANQRSLY
jgi:hypothetical protein